MIQDWHTLTFLTGNLLTNFLILKLNRTGNTLSKEISEYLVITFFSRNFPADILRLTVPIARFVRSWLTHLFVQCLQEGNFDLNHWNTEIEVTIGNTLSPTNRTEPFPCRLSSSLVDTHRCRQSCNPAWSPPCTRSSLRAYTECRSRLDRLSSRPQHRPSTKAKFSFLRTLQIHFSYK